CLPLLRFNALHKSLQILVFYQITVQIFSICCSINHVIDKLVIQNYFFDDENSGESITLCTQLQEFISLTGSVGLLGLK
ncbi:uncharacterized protein METZ01_LOCUS396839, partial [marine metagenome]